MKEKIEFTEIDLQTWNRVEMYYYFSKMAPTGYSITVDVDVTHLRRILKENEKKFFPAYLWLVTKTLMEQDEFKIAEIDGKVGKFNTLTPLYAAFHNDDKTFSLLWTQYDDDFSAFYDAYMEDKKQYGDNHGVLAKKQPLPPPNAYTISCIPWVNFKHFALHSYDNKPYYFPTIEAGRFYEKDGKTYMPLSITCHHATTDGYHVNKFIEAFQRYMDEFKF